MKRLMVTAAAALIAGATAFTAPVLRAHASTCAWPGAYSHATGNTFQDGVQPSAQSDVNMCNGGTPGYQGDDGHFYDQYFYGVGMACGGCAASEQDVNVHGRGWVCGKLTYTYGPADWGSANSVSSPWYNMGNSGDVGYDFCGDQHDWTVKITAWDGETWSTYLNEDNEGCSFECS